MTLEKYRVKRTQVREWQLLFYVNDAELLAVQANSLK